MDAKPNQPIAAVSIAVKGTDRGTQTDQNGNFVIEARAGEVLVASIIGYGSLELPVAEQVEFSLVPDEETLEEVVVVGYGTQRSEERRVGKEGRDGRWAEHGKRRRWLRDDEQG